LRDIAFDVAFLMQFVQLRCYRRALDQHIAQLGQTKFGQSSVANYMVKTACWTLWSRSAVVPKIKRGRRLGFDGPIGGWLR